jgi:multidrug efflux pump subunit AcrB
MKTSLKFAAVVAITALLTISTPAQIISFIGACALLGAVVVHRKRQSHAE